MLILTRKANESIIIKDNIEIIVVGIEDGKVKLGIKAPKEIDIYRKEVYETIQNENKQAAATKPIHIDLLKDFFK
ncbi:carbon storage regulator, CsrA [Proteiniborus ethanoligenes]|uniref:Translational regulator CsrA n=1 Tax=Proteiniborus ethanoligenes TaxID=415015 RepID=A0A1H3S5M7_9FIRM|nr:carbon storage regulator CsrA [Proteiniborus ethanoligenes]SDZ32885.1 carbon storage regulator, CsrA [Proteiniborus ethanoligenes]